MIKFIWTPGYCRFLGNEKADKIARQRMNNLMTERPSYFTLIDIQIET